MMLWYILKEKNFLDAGEDRKIILVFILRKQNAIAWTVFIAALENMGTQFVLRRWKNP